jgi:F-type H+-transporting ATPase subunit b
MPFSTPLGVMLAGGSPVDLDGSIFVQLGIFFVAFFILRSLVFKPVMELFDAREQAIAGSRSLAQSLESDADAKREHFESQLHSVRQQASEDRQRLQTQAEQLARELTEKARRESAAALSSAKAQLDLESKTTRQKAQAEVPAIARQIAEKLLGRSVH